MRRPAAFLALLLAGGLAPGCAVRERGRPPSCPGLAESQAAPARLVRLAGGRAERRPFPPPPVSRFLSRRFSPYTRHGGDRAASRWAWTAFGEAGLLDETLRPVDRAWFERMDREAAWDRAGRIGRPGVALRTANLRAMPTSHPLIGDPSAPGQGFPFDRLQNGLVLGGEPVWLSHRSASGRWIFVWTAAASGWVLDRDVAPVAPELAAALPRMTPVAVVREGFPIRTGDGRFLFAGRIGMVLPSAGGDGTGRLRVLVPAGRNADGTVAFQTVVLERGQAVPIPLDPTVAHLAGLASRMLGLPYGWGGAFGGRDCSAFVRDFFTPFGLWLPRNSRAQAAAGQRIDLKGLEPAAKARRIVRLGRPFATLLVKPGHVALYVGADAANAPVVLHAVWDLGARERGAAVRRHVGHAVLTVLRPSPGPAPGCAVTLLDALETMTQLGGALSPGRGAGTLPAPQGGGETHE